MATTCFRSLQGIAMRVTTLDGCCEPVGGPCATVVSESFVTITLTRVLTDAQEFEVILANGRTCLSEVGCATLKRYNVVVTICVADPDLFNIVTGVDPVLDFNGDVVGYVVTEDLGGCGNFSLEIWTKVPRDQCTAGGDVQYLYWLAPCVTAGIVGDVTIENGPLTFSFEAQAIPSSAWGVGPYDVVAQDALGTPGPLLAPIPSRTALLVTMTVTPPPTEVCGCQELVLPS